MKQNEMQITKIGDGFVKFVFDSEQIKNLLFEIMQEISSYFLQNNGFIVTETIQKYGDKNLGFIFNEINKTVKNLGLEFKLNKNTYNRNLYQDKVLTKLFEYVPCFLDYRFKLSYDVDYDLLFNDIKIDCKAKNKNGKYLPQKNHDISITSNCVKRGKYCDYFLFGTYDRNDIFKDNIAFTILGFISYDEFIKNSHFRPIGSELYGTGQKCKMEEYVLDVGSLYDIDSFIWLNS